MPVKELFEGPTALAWTKAVVRQRTELTIEGLEKLSKKFPLAKILG
jgi:hypothetical protein